MRILFFFVFLSSVAFGQSKIGAWSNEDKSLALEYLKKENYNKETEICILEFFEKEYSSFSVVNSKIKDPEKIEDIITKIMECYMANIKLSDDEIYYNSLPDPLNKPDIEISIKELIKIAKMDKKSFINHAKSLGLIYNDSSEDEDYLKSILFSKNNATKDVSAIYIRHFSKYLNKTYASNLEMEMDINNDVIYKDIKSELTTLGFSFYIEYNKTEEYLKGKEKIKLSIDDSYISIQYSME